MKTSASKLILLSHPGLAMFQVCSLAFILTLSARGQLSGPVQEGPDLLGPGNSEFALTASWGSLSCWSDNQFLAKIGVKVGRGISRRVDLKVSFVRDCQENIADGFNILQLIPKISTRKSSFILCLPVGIFHRSHKSRPEEKQAELAYFICPSFSQVIWRGNWFDLCLGGYVEAAAEQKNRILTTSAGVTGSAGIHDKPGKFSYRTEFGFDLLNLAKGMLSCHLAFCICYKIQARKNPSTVPGQNPDRHYANLNKLLNNL